MTTVMINIMPTEILRKQASKTLAICPHVNSPSSSPSAVDRISTDEFSFLVPSFKAYDALFW